MKTTYALPAVALLGLGVAIFAVIHDNQRSARVPTLLTPAQSPYTSFVAGAGIIEARSGNIAIGTPIAGIVTAIDVTWGDLVKPGDVLFKIDDRDVHGQQLRAVAKVKQAEAALAKAQNFLGRGERLGVGPISAMELANRQFDAAIAEAALGSAQAAVAQLDIDAERRIIRTPVAGRVLQINTHLGEFAQSGGVNAPVMMLGDDARLHVRVDIDESVAWRVQSGAAATGVLRNNPTLEIPLRFVRIERLVVPKVSLTGNSTERTDMRVLQVIFSFDPAALSVPVYVGQQLDVVVAAPAASGSTSAAGPASGRVR